MSSLRVIETTAAQWGVSPQLPRVLRAPCGQHVPESECSGGHDGRGQAEHRPLCHYVWPGRRDGARAPDTGETPLSPDEVWHGVREGLIP